MTRMTPKQTLDTLDRAGDMGMIREAAVTPSENGSLGRIDKFNVDQAAKVLSAHFEKMGRVGALETLALIGMHLVECGLEYEQKDQNTVGYCICSR